MRLTPWRAVAACLLSGTCVAGIAAAARWIGRHLPVSALNTIVATPGELWGLTSARAGNCTCQATES